MGPDLVPKGEIPSPLTKPDNKEPVCQLLNAQILIDGNPAQPPMSPRTDVHCFRYFAHVGILGYARKNVNR